MTGGGHVTSDKPEFRKAAKVSTKVVISKQKIFKHVKKKDLTFDFCSDNKNQEGKYIYIDIDIYL